MDKKILRPTVAQINIGAVRSNYRTIRELTKEKILAVVKADAYGHGAVEIAGVLSEEGTDILGVATIEEGIQLREAGINTPVLVLGSVYPFENYRFIMEYNLTPIVASFQSASALEDAARAAGRQQGAHMKVDTGMGRIGVSDSTAVKLWKKLDDSTHIIPEGVFTHFPRADEDYSYTMRQLKIFNLLVSRLNPAPPLIHASNTAGMLNPALPALNMVRPGLALYGLYPDNVSKVSVGLEPVLAFKSAVIFLKRVEKSTPISYGGTWRAPRDSVVATVCAGYADGYRRGLSNKADIIIRGKRCPVIGRVCMDMIMVDVTALSEVNIGDEAVLLGRSGKEEISAEEIARICGTINYEITIGISSRVPRVFVENKNEDPCPENT